MSLFAGIDLGTSGARCLIVDEHGRRVALGGATWTYRRDSPGIATLDPEDVCDAVRVAVAAALNQAGGAGAIDAIGVTSQRSGCAFIDGDGREVYLGPNADGRAVAEGLALERSYGQEIYRIAGRLPVLIYMPARLAWFRAHAPDVCDRIEHVLSLSDWLVWRLTGEARTEPTQAAELLVYDVAQSRWSDTLTDALDVPPAILPAIGAAGEPAGVVRDGAFGFRTGTPVIPAGGDTQTAAIGMGAIEPGDVIAVAGTTMICAHVRDTYEPDAAARLWGGPHALPGRYVSEAHCGEAGAAIDWLATVLDMVPEELMIVAEDAVPGAGGVAFYDAYPSTVGDFPLVRTGGFLFPVPLLALGRGREDIARAAVEGLAFGACAGFEWLREANGDAGRLFAAGGVSRSHPFRSALAGACERTIVFSSDPHASALGAAIVAASGHHGGIARAVSAMHDRGQPIAPNPDEGYAFAYSGWRQRAQQMDELAVRMRTFLA